MKDIHSSTEQKGFTINRDTIIYNYLIIFVENVKKGDHALMMIVISMAYCF